MVKSMTGYGHSATSVDELKITVEIKTLNSKYADISVRLPTSLSSREINIRKLVGESLIRGKISVTIDVIEPEIAVKAYDTVLLSKYYEQLKSLSKQLGDEGNELFKLALHSPDVTRLSNESFSEQNWQSVIQCITDACDACNAFREQEGLELSRNVEQYAKTINDILSRIDAKDEDRINRISTKLRSATDELKMAYDIDPGRIEQEMLFYIEKLDIQEEKVRLQNHINYFLEVLEKETPNGKKLSFICQEMGREINTIGSKANDATMQHLVVQMKEELEKIKEQVLNIL